MFGCENCHIQYLSIVYPVSGMMVISLYPMVTEISRRCSIYPAQLSSAAVETNQRAILILAATAPDCTEQHAHLFKPFRGYPGYPVSRLSRSQYPVAGGIIRANCEWLDQASSKSPPQLSALSSSSRDQTYRALLRVRSSSKLVS